MLFRAHRPLTVCALFVTKTSEQGKGTSPQLLYLRVPELTRSSAGKIFCWRGGSGAGSQNRASLPVDVIFPVYSIVILENYKQNWGS
jgi:hypothetical protein